MSRSLALLLAFVALVGVSEARRSFVDIVEQAVVSIRDMKQDRQGDADACFGVGNQPLFLRMGRFNPIEPSIIGCSRSALWQD
jgi:hypothetical protein